MIHTYMVAYLEFKYDSQFATLEDIFNTLNFNQYEASPSSIA
jgi:hypothetical protein